MTTGLYLPLDADVDVAADFLELQAFFARDSVAYTGDLGTTTEIGEEHPPADLDEYLRRGEEEVVSNTVSRIEGRQRCLGPAYPFELDERGDVLACTVAHGSLDHAAYVLSLILSNLNSILAGSPRHPSNDEVRALRNYFQYFATAALAAEIHGPAWSFGAPRLDGSGFLAKLREIWLVVRDGRVAAQAGAPARPQDDKIDVFAARPQADRLQGYLFAAAQVATGQDARNKTLKGHLSAFKSRWFESQPVTEWLAYWIVPFAIADEQFLDDVRILGNVLHRMRLPLRVREAEDLVAQGVAIEGYTQLGEAVTWVARYRGQAIAEQRG